MINTNGLSKEFPGPKGAVVRACQGVTFHVEPGEIFGLLGVNGAGKTTCLRMLSTVIRPTAGSASVCGYDVVKDADRVRASIGFLSSSTALYGRLNAVDVLRYFGNLFGMSGARLNDRLAFVIDKLKLDEFKDRLCDKLSTGQKQRVSIARAILHDPPVLFFDEPTAGLDVVTSQTIMEFIEESRVQGKAIVFSTHIMSEAERLCDRIGIIHEGRLADTGSVNDLLVRAGEPTLEKAFLKAVQYRSELANA